MVEVDVAPTESALERSIDWRQVRLILGARWRIVFKAAADAWWKVLLKLLAWAMFAGVVALATTAAYVGMSALRASNENSHVAAPVLHAGFLLVLVWLALSPALGLRGNEFLDVTKLFTFPVSHRTVFAASLAGLATSGSVLFLTLPLLAAVAGYGGSTPEILGGLFAVVLVALTGVTIGQIGLLLFLDIFRSRKWRDASRLIMALLGAGIYASMRFMSGRALSGGFFAAMGSLDHWKDWMLFLPSWWGAHAVTGTGALRWLPALALPLLVFGLVRVAARLQERAYFGEIEERRITASDSGGGLAALFARRVRGPFGAALEKDLRLLFRDPTVRIRLIQRFAYSVMPIAVGVLNSGSRGAWSPDHLLYVAIYLPVLALAGSALNPLGTEGPGIQQSLLTPVPRRTILAGKVAALAIVMGGGAATLAGVATLVISLTVGHLGTGEAALRAILAALEAWAAFGVAAAVGAIVGALLPTRILSRGRRALSQSSSGNSGCFISMAYSLAMLGVIVACLPVAFAFHHPVLLGLAQIESAPYLALSVPLALAYAFLLGVVGVRVGGRILESREEMTIAILAKPGE